MWVFSTFAANVIVGGLQFPSAAFVKCGVAGIEIPGIHIFLRGTQSITEAINLSFVYCMGCE